MSHCDCIPATDSLYDRKDKKGGRERERVCVCENEREMDNESFTTKTI